MTEEISWNKTSEILRNHFLGKRQCNNSAETGVHQATVSHKIQDFTCLSNQVGLAKAAEEYDVSFEIRELRALAVELRSLKLTTESAAMGTKIISVFQQLGIAPEKYLELVNVCQQISDKQFIQAACCLTEVTRSTGCQCNEIVKVLVTEGEKLTATKQQYASLSNAIKRAKQELADNKAQLEDTNQQLIVARQTVAQQQKALDQKIEESLASASVTLQQINRFTDINKMLVQHNLDVDIFSQLATDSLQANNQLDGKLIRKDLSRYGSLSKCLQQLTTQNAELKTKMGELTSTLNQLTQYRKDLESDINQRRRQLSALSEQMELVSRTVESKSEQLAVFEGLIAMLGSPPTSGNGMYNLQLLLEYLNSRGWEPLSSQSLDTLRERFVRIIMGEYIHCYTCSACGADFLINELPRNQIMGYQCPACGMLGVKANDSLLGALGIT